MNLEDYYLDEGHVSITAASVGISAKRWISIREQEVNSINHLSIMKSRRFDVLPIIPNSGGTFEYFKTDVPNDYTSASRHIIGDNDKIPLDTEIRKVIKKFAQEKRHHYFLTYEEKVTGLITIGNLNCKQVQVFLFSKICELERSLGDFINYNLKNEEIENYIKEKAKASDKFKIILYNYRELISLDLENNITEHLFLVDFFDIIQKFLLHSKELNISSNQWKSMSSINELRNLIAHPTRSLLDRQNSIEKLDARLQIVEDLTQAIKQYRNNAGANSDFTSADA